MRMDCRKRLTHYDWTQYSLLKLHPGTCVVMRIKPKRKTMSVNSFYDIDQTRLKIVKTEKDLGIVFDDELSFREHINCKVKKANSLAGIIRRTFLHMDKIMFKRLFVAIVRPHLEYGAPIWNPYNKDMINIIEKVQRRATRQVEGFRNKTYRERLEDMKLPTLKYRRYRGDMIECYKISHDLYDNEIINNFLRFRPNDRQYLFRGHRFNLPKEHFKKDVRKFSFRYSITNQWNNLPEKIVDATNIMFSRTDWMIRK